MADTMCNIARGKVNEYTARVVNNDPANSAIVLVLLKAAEADAVLQDYDDLGTLLAAGGNTEADFTNYARKVLPDVDLTAPTPDDTNNWQTSDAPDQTWTNAGGATNNALVKMLICYDADTTAGTDSNIIPLAAMDFVKTTNGSDLQSLFDAVGWYKARS